MRMADVFRALGMVDRDGKPFDETEIRRQVMASLGVSAPVIETGPTPKPPFRTWESCLQACLSLPVDPGDAEDFDRHAPETGALAVGAVLFLELTDGTVRMRLSKGQGNVMISGLIGCDVAAVIPAGSGPLEAGTELKGFFLR